MNLILYRIAALLIPCLALSVTSASAKEGERRFAIGSYDELAVDGDIIVDLITGSAATATAKGELRDLDRVQIERTGSKLKVRMVRPLSGGKMTAPVRIGLTSHELDTVSLRGGGQVSISRLSGSTMKVNLQGAGTVRIGKVEGVALGVSLVGNGRVEIGGGRADAARVEVNGAGSVEAPSLMVETLKLYHLGPASTRIGAKRTAEIYNNGAGEIAITGKPQCFIRAAGSGDILCGKQAGH